MTRLQPIVGELMRLRPVMERDAEALWEGAQDPEIASLLGPAVSASRESVASWAREVGSVPGRYDLAVTALASDTMIGEIVLEGIDPEARRARLHMWMLAGHRGRGYGREAIFRVLELAFTPVPLGLGLHRTSLVVPTLDPRARSLYASFGFREEGVLREHVRTEDGYVDAMVMGLLAGELEQSQGMFTPRAMSAGVATS